LEEGDALGGLQGAPPAEPLVEGDGARQVAHGEGDQGQALLHDGRLGRTAARHQEGRQMPEGEPSTPFDRLSGCLGSQAVAHGFCSLMTALRMVRSFLATATRATILGFPAARRRSRKSLSRGLWRAATMAAMNR